MTKHYWHSGDSYWENYPYWYPFYGLKNVSKRTFNFNPKKYPQFVPQRKFSDEVFGKTEHITMAPRKHRRSSISSTSSWDSNPFHAQKRLLIGPATAEHHKNAEAARKKHAAHAKGSTHHERLEVLRGGLLSDHQQIYLRKKKHVKYTGAWRLQYDVTGGLQAAYGAQKADVLFSINSLSQMINNTALPYTKYQSPGDPFEYNPYQSTTNASIPGTSSVVVARPKDDQVYFINQEVKLLLSNMDSTACQVELWWVQAKHDLPIGQTPLAAWETGLQNQALSNVVYTTHIGAVAPTQGYPTSGVLYASPNESKLFHQLYKVLKVNKFRLDPQGTYDNTTIIHYNQKLKRDELTAVYNSSSNYFAKGKTVFCMMVARGNQILRDTVAADTETSTGAGTGATITSTYSKSVTCAADIRWVANMKYHCQGVPDNASRLNVQSVVQQQYYNPATVTALNVNDQNAAPTSTY